MKRLILAITILLMLGCTSESHTHSHFRVDSIAAGTNMRYGTFLGAGAIHARQNMKDTWEGDTFYPH